MATVSAEVRFAPQLTAWFTANPTKVLQDGEIVYCSDGANVGKYVIGDNGTQLSALTFYGGISSSGLTIGTTTITSGTNTRILYNNNGVLGEYAVTGTGTTAVLSTSPTFTTDITTPLINGVGSLLTLNTRTKVLEGTSDVLIGERSAGNGCIWIGQSASPTASNFVLGGSVAGVTILNGSGTDGTINIRSLGSNILIMKGASTTGSNISNEWTPLAKTNETATSLASNLFRVSPNGTQYTTGSTMAIHTDYYFRSNTVTSTSATQTITDATGLYIESPTISTNTTATNTFSLIGSGNAKFIVGSVTGGIQIRDQVGTSTTGAIYMGVATPSANNYILWGTAGSTVLNGTASTSTLDLRLGNVMRARFDNTAFQFTTGNATSGANTDFLYTCGTHTSQTLSTNIPNFKVTGSTKQWATGALATQYFNYFSANTVAFVGASTATNVYGLYVEAATAGANATITNNYAAGFGGNVNIIGAPYINGVAPTGTGSAVLSTSPTFSTSIVLSVGNVAASTSGMTITNTNTSGYGTSLYFRGTSGSTYDYCAIQSENSGTGGLIRFQTANTSQVMTTRAEINSAGNMSVGFSVPFANLQVGRASADSATATTAINTSFYFGVGRAEYTLNSYRLIGLGYNTSTTTTFPTYIGYQEMSVSGKTKGDLIFGTRSVTTDTDPTERLRISNMGNISVGNAALATTATDGFLYVTACAGVPTGVPTAITGRIPIVADSTNNKLYIYSGGAWVALN